jgi:hypothetical protein
MATLYYVIKNTQPLEGTRGVPSLREAVNLLLVRAAVLVELEDGEPGTVLLDESVHRGDPILARMAETMRRRKRRGLGSTVRLSDPNSSDQYEILAFQEDKIG